MKQTRSAMAMLARPSLLISVFGRQCESAASIAVASGAMSPDPYATELRSQGDRVATQYPEAACRWQGDELVFPKAAEDGFEITLQLDSRGVIVLTDVGLHVHVDGAPADAVQDALGLVRDLLTPDMRVVELRAGGGGYRWRMERLESGRWLVEAQTGLLFWNYFGRRSERTYQNRRLPGRLAEQP